MPADSIKTLGTTLHMSTEVGSPQTFVLIGNLVDFSGPDGSRNIIGTSNLSSTAATKMAGLLDEGNFNFNINLDPSVTSHQNLRTAHHDGQVREFKVTFTDSGAAELHFNAIMQSAPISGPFDDKVTQSVTLAITGESWLVL